MSEPGPLPLALAPSRARRRRLQGCAALQAAGGLALLGAAASLEPAAGLLGAALACLGAAGLCALELVTGQSLSGLLGYCLRRVRGLPPAPAPEIPDLRAGHARFVGRQLVVWEAGGRSVSIWHDAVDAQAYRRLVVRARWGRAPERSA